MCLNTQPNQDQREKIMMTADEQNARNHITLKRALESLQYYAAELVAAVVNSSREQRGRFPQHIRCFCPETGQYFKLVHSLVADPEWGGPDLSPENVSIQESLFILEPVTLNSPLTQVSIAEQVMMAMNPQDNDRDARRAGGEEQEDEFEPVVLLQADDDEDVDDDEDPVAAVLGTIQPLPPLSSETFTGWMRRRREMDGQESSHIVDTPAPAPAPAPTPTPAVDTDREQALDRRLREILEDRPISAEDFVSNSRPPLYPQYQVRGTETGRISASANIRAEQPVDARVFGEAREVEFVPGDRETVGSVRFTVLDEPALDDVHPGYPAQPVLDRLRARNQEAGVYRVVTPRSGLTNEMMDHVVNEILEGSGLATSEGVTTPVVPVTAEAVAATPAIDE